MQQNCKVNKCDILGSVLYENGKVESWKLQQFECTSVSISKSKAIKVKH